MDSLRKNGSLLAVMGLFLLIAVLATSSLLWLAHETDAKYIPLIGSCITGIITLCSVAIAWLSLWVAFKNVANPFRVELLKRQTDLICELSQSAQTYSDLLVTWEADRRPDTMGDRYSSHLTAYMGLWKRHRDNTVLLPEAINAAISEFLAKSWDYAGKIHVDGERHTDMIAVGLKFREEIVTLLNVCREALHTDKLTAETAKLIQSNSPTHLIK